MLFDSFHCEAAAHKLIKYCIADVRKIKSKGNNYV